MTADWRETLRSVGLGPGYAGRHVGSVLAIWAIMGGGSSMFLEAALDELQDKGYIEPCQEHGGCVVLTAKADR